MLVDVTALPTITAAIREFLTNTGYLEIFTPTLATHRIPEDHLQLFDVKVSAELQENYAFIDGEGTLRESAYLLPSPEYYHKYLLSDPALSAQVGTGIFEIAHSYRLENAAARVKSRSSLSFQQGERPAQDSAGSIHGNEFLMLEYYTLDASAKQSLAITTDLLKAVYKRAKKSLPPLSCISMKDLFYEYAGIDLAELCAKDSLDEMKKQITDAGHRLPAQGSEFSSFEEYFHYILVTSVEPALQLQDFVFVTDYPQRVPTLSKALDNSPWAQRWELYYRGIEIANCFVEEVELEKIASYISSQDTACEAPPWLSTRRQVQSSGVALGVERLAIAVYAADGLANISSLQYLQDR